MSEHGPWSKVISRNESALGYGINLAFSSMCNEYHSMIPDNETNLLSSDVLHNDSNFAEFTLNGEIKQGSITQCLSKDLEDVTKEHLDLIYTQNGEGCFRDGILKNDVFIEAVRCTQGLPSYILEPFADGHHFIGLNATLVDAHDIMVKIAMLINGDYHRMRASIQSLIIDIFKKPKYGLFANPKTCVMTLSQLIFSNNIAINIRLKNSSFPI